MTSRRVRIAAGAAVVLVVAGSVTFYVVRERRRQVVVQTQRVGRRDVVSVVSASGEIRPKRYVNVSSNTSGRIVQMLVKEGDSVRERQVLARIDSTRVEAGERQSEAALQAARADLVRAQADLEATRLAYERQKQMHAEKLVSDQAFDQAEAEVKMKRAMVESQRRRVNQQEAALASNRDELEKTTVVSPMTGVVTNLQKEEGESVIGAQSFSPTVIMTVADLSVMEVEILVDETDIRDVHLTQPAEVRVDALAGTTIKGEVTEIGSSAIPRVLTGGGGSSTSQTNTSNQAKDFKVTVTLKDPPPSLRPGLNATADITTARKTRVMAVPIQAVVVRELNAAGNVVDAGSAQAADERPAGRSRGRETEGVFLVKSGKAFFKPVKTGILGDTEIEVIEGVSEGDEIVTGSYKTLRTLKDQSHIRLEKKKENA